MVKGWIALIAMWIGVLSGFYIGYESGQKSVKQIDKVCPEQKAKLISSSHSNAGMICVYQESWQRKGKIKRVEL